MTEQTHKILLLGDQAVALGAIHAGLSGVYAYFDRNHRIYTRQHSCPRKEYLLPLVC